MFWKLARKIDAEETVRVNLRLCQDLVHATRRVVPGRSGSREHHRRSQLKASAGQPSRGGQCGLLLHLGLRAGRALPLTMRHLHPRRRSSARGCQRWSPRSPRLFPVPAPGAIRALRSLISFCSHMPPLKCGNHCACPPLCPVGTGYLVVTFDRPPPGQTPRRPQIPPLSAFS
jgi:hypothetical protein